MATKTSSATQALCGICNEHTAKYKCPKCMVKYCCVKCFKSAEHQARDAEAQVDDKIIPQVEDDIKDATPSDDPVLSNPKILAMLKSPTLQVHLSEIAALYQRTELSGEITTEGRQRVALNKLKQLRPGGKEANEEVEEFVNAILEISNHSNE